MDELKVMMVKVYHFTKWENGKTIPLAVHLIHKAAGKGETFKFDATFRIYSPQNPLPIKGEFHSSVSVLFAWLKENGWVQLNHTNTILHHYH